MDISIPFEFVITFLFVIFNLEMGTDRMTTIISNFLSFA
jgi:hypothetical protein